MERKLRVLCIAPYEGMKRLIISLSDDYPQIELTTYVGDLQQGLQIAKANFHKNFDAVISRGMTAELLKQQLPIPVIGVDISIYDILCALKLANPENNRTAIVSFLDITTLARQLCDIIGCKIDIYTLQSAQNAETVLRDCQSQNYSSILCDMVVNQTARRLGLNAFLITSGTDSIRHAIDQVIATCRNQSELRSENNMLRKLINNQISQTVLFDSKGNVILSTSDDPDPGFLKMLQEEISETIVQKERRIIHNRNCYIYSIRALQIGSDEQPSIAFFFTKRKSPIPSEKSGLSFYTSKDVEHKFYSSLLCFAGTIEHFSGLLEKVIKSNHSIIVSGEIGTGKESLVEYIYINSHLHNNPLVVIDCSLLNDKAWDFLIEHHASPFSESNNVIHFQNIEQLTPTRITLLMTNLIAMEVCENNLVIFSFNCINGQQISPIGSLFADRFCALSLFIPPLREQQDCISSLFNQTLNSLSSEIPHNLAGVDPEALDLLKSYPWPHNFTQFLRVSSELAITTEGPIVTATDVRGAIQKEQHIGYVTTLDESFKPINFNRPLKDIETDIIRRVLEENNGNQSEAAKRLGISRTTLWRLLKG